MSDSVKKHQKPLSREICLLVECLAKTYLLRLAYREDCRVCGRIKHPRSWSQRSAADSHLHAHVLTEQYRHSKPWFQSTQQLCLNGQNYALNGTIVCEPDALPQSLPCLIFQKSNRCLSTSQHHPEVHHSDMKDFGDYYVPLIWLWGSLFTYI